MSTFIGPRLRACLATPLESTVVMHRGLLMALAELRRTFNSHGTRFHDAYRAAMDAYNCEAAHEAIDSYDAVFSVYTEAEAMILEGVRDCVLTLDAPRLVRARFKLSAEQARDEVEQLVWAPAFRTMASAMHRRLGDE